MAGDEQWQVTSFEETGVLHDRRSETHLMAIINPSSGN